MESLEWTLIQSSWYPKFKDILGHRQQGESHHHVNTRKRLGGKYMCQGVSKAPEEGERERDQLALILSHSSLRDPDLSIP